MTTTIGNLTLFGSVTLGDPVFPVLAAVGLQTAISLLFVIIAFLSWLFSVISGNQNVPKAGGRPNPPPGGKRIEKDLQAEINRFLKNVTGEKDDTDELVVLEDIEDERRPRSRP
ncbi:MAG TPA: hypothetical protein VK137_11505, partial [Planctomycetaceae bacterium]|nr:hypothetical protein [Planctomycetaceae bacterium]